MKLKKGLMQIVTIIAVLAMALSIATVSNATRYSSGSERLLKINIPTYRPVYLNGEWRDAYSYKVAIKSSDGSILNAGDNDGFEMWKIYEYNKNSTTQILNRFNALYCLKGGAGFGSVGGNTTREKLYNVYADMKSPANTEDTNIINNYKNNIMAAESGYNKDQKYNALMWVLDHCYVPAPSSQYGQNTETEQRARAYRNKLLTEAGISNSAINDDMIDIVQQIAIWYFTNNDGYKGDYVDGSNNKLGISQVKVKTATGAGYVSLDSVFGQTNYLRDMQKLFTYFVDGGVANKNTAPVNTSTAPVAFENTTAVAEVDENYYIAGPYKLNQLTTGVEYDLTASVKEGNNTISYTLLDSNKQAVSGNNIKSVVGNNFYIRVPKTVNLDNVSINVTWTINQNTITYLTIAGSENSEQPVAEIKPETKSGILTANIQYRNQIFDLALRKYISAVETNGTTTTFENNGERKANVDTTALAAETATTATYKHRKDPVLVETGSKVTYKLNIYNEGNVAGRATKVIDQLPAGVKFLNVVSGNFESDGSYTETNNKLTLVRKSGNTTDLAAFTNGNLASETIEILCQVTALPDENNDKIYTNIAWIAEYASNAGTFTDRDSDGNNPSMPSNLITTDVGYINETKNSGKQLDNKNSYFEGQQDDDDFEKIKVKAIKGSYDIVLVKEDKDGEDINATATFEVNGEQKTVTGRLTIVSNKTITAENVTEIDTYIIKELVPPDKYCKFDGTIKVEVYKELKNGKYVVKEVKHYVDNVLVTSPRTDLKVYLNENGNIYVEVKDYQFDLALRKFITKVNGENVPTREPVIQTESNAKLQSGDITTVEKHHTKNPVRVQIGDTVLYTIRIYNEGDVAGYATEVTDYLPQGLTFKTNSDINTRNGWTNPSGDGKTIVTKYLANKLIPALAAGETPAYEDIEIECVVTAGVSASSQWLKNVAEITEDKDEKGNDVEDRDSTPKNLTEEQKSDYNPGESEIGWGYEDDDDYEDLVIPAKEFDLALRKFIVSVNGKELKNADETYTREPNIDLTKLKSGMDTTAEYKHEKEPVNVSIGSEVIYSLRVYNEGDIDGYVSEITDHLPKQLEFINDDFNASYGWKLDPSDNTQRTVKTNILAKSEIDPEENLLKAYNGENSLDYKEVKIKCRVKATDNMDKVITNIADITAFTDANGNVIRDRDSFANPGVVLPSDNDLPDYKGNTSNKSILSDKNYHYKGQQDDDDFEKLILQEFDLALRKFITKINDEEITSRKPVVDVSKLKAKQSTTATYTHPKNPLTVETTDIVEYTIRVYNEGDISGYANVVKDDIPKGLQFLPEDAVNVEYRWKMLDEDGNETDDVSKAVDIVTDYLSKDQEIATGRDNLIDAFDAAKNTLDYRDVKVAFKVIAPNTYTGIITNKAQISDDEDENGKEVEDRDSTPDVWIEGEDDQDVEHIKLLYFDLALRKFITGVNDKEVKDRIPVFKIDENGKYIYEHTKEPVELENKNVVTYTLRIFNEGTRAGYANVVKDDIPEGLEFLPDNEVNKEYRWVMIDEDGNETKDVSKAKSIITDYLSIEQERETGRNNLLKAFDISTMESPDYRDIKAAFKVTEPNTSNRIIINHAQISDDKDENGKDVTDIDSTPDKWIEGEDDQDIEKIKVKYFDLALRKWVTQAIVIENGEETVIETGHKAEDDPEEVVKVDLKEKNYKNVTVKFRYSIRIKNEGQIAGYCTEISDYIPEGLKFVQEDNPDWKEVDGKIVTDKLKDTLLQPGDTAEVEVLLTWINGKDNFGLKINTAEISKDKNDSDTPDIDSTPNNKKPGEDDIDDAPVILTVKTGVENVMPIVGIATVSIAIISTGAMLIKKYVL